MTRLILISFLLLSVVAVAAAAPATGDYPITDPLAATVVGTPRAYRAELPSSVPIEVRELAPLVERAVPPVLAYAEPLEYTLAAQDHAAPLIYIIAGTGAGARGNTTGLLTRALYAKGYHVVTLPSPTSVAFILGAASHPVPGRNSVDVRDLYRMMRAVDAELEDELQISSYALTGYSLGALQAAFLAHLDQTKGRFDFQRVLLINPAVNIYRSVRRMDNLLATGLEGGIAGLPRFLDRVLGEFKRVYAEGAPVEFNEDFLYRAYLASDTDRDDIAAVIGLAFRLWLANMGFAADILSRSGVIVPAAERLSGADSLERYLLRSFSLSFSEYIDRLLLPYYNRDGRQLSRSQLIAEGRLARIGDYLAGAEHIGVVTNADDLILDVSDLSFLRATFGERATIFEHGGHLGNLADRNTIAAIQAFLQP